MTESRRIRWRSVGSGTIALSDKILADTPKTQEGAAAENPAVPPAPKRVRIQASLRAQEPIDGPKPPQRGAQGPQTGDLE